MGRKKLHKSAVPHRSKLKKEPGIPKLPDLKLRNAEKHKTLPPTRLDPDVVMASEPTLSSLAKLASEVARDSGNQPSSSGTSLRTKEQIRRHYVRALHKVVDESDIVILVLDARDPNGCRSQLVEEEVRRRESEGKKLVFVLNKIDLVPRENAQQWLRYLRHSTPTLPFRSASSNQRSNLSSATAPALLRLLKSHKPAAQSVTVGVVGFPNVGKSSLINSLKRSKVCAVAAQAGHTKEIQTVQLERGIKIIDSPGVIFDEDDHESGSSQRQKGSVLLRNVVKVEDIEDPIAVVEEIFERTEHEVLRKIYNLPQFSSTLEFLTMHALSSGRLLKGGTPDVLAAARQVLMDWNHQKIPYFSIPPIAHPSSVPSTIPSAGDGVIAPGAENVGQVKIVTGLSKPFELAGLFEAADAGAFDNQPNAGEVNMEEASTVPGYPEGSEMVVEETAHLPRKRRHSPSPASEQPLQGQTQALSVATTHMPKRFRRAKDLSAYEEAAARSHPLNRKTLKRDAKRARRAAARSRKAMAQGSGMEVDDLCNTFIAGVET
ncbi:P-loop containing nucleoside triphosphate hydrolase protein [Pisolithus croceorrhizus]|nr:P-loop containing nucleoside triphosphate hydrolase protein [Pisolithus croceorrhizus]